MVVLRGLHLLCRVIMRILCMRKQSLIFIIIANYWAECWLRVFGCQRRPAVSLTHLSFHLCSNKWRYLGMCLQQNVTCTHLSTQSVSPSQHIQTVTTCFNGRKISLFPDTYSEIWFINRHFCRIQCSRCLIVSKGCSVPMPVDKGSNFVCVW